MQPLAVELQLLSELRGVELRLNPGRALMARVMTPADANGRGTLNIAGAAIEAQLPRELRPGDQVRLVVRALDAQRVVLEMSREGGAPPPSVPAVPVGLPGGGTIQVNPDADAAAHDTGGRAAPGTRTVLLRYDAPALGGLDLRFELEPAALRITVAAPRGEPLALAQSRADELRSALAARSDRPVSVSVTARREPLDVYA